MEFKHQIQNLKIELELLKKQLQAQNQSNIIVEDDGTILSIKCEKNKYVSKNEILFAISDNSNNYKIEFELNKAKSKLISTGDEAVIKVDGNFLEIQL